MGLNYEDYIQKWLGGIAYEIAFWNSYMANEGGSYFFDFYRTVSGDRKFELDDDIPQTMYGKEYSFIDVGSGPFSRCGVVSSVVILDAISVDPLAYVYNELKSKFKIDNGIKLINGFVELLDKQFAENSFDMVHMSNSLDHCFSPVDGIYQLLNVCKIGGKVVLRHHENEAQNENYKGLHQWNLSLNNPEKSFIVWRRGERIDICKVFEDYADFELYPNQKEGENWVYNKVIMTKVKGITMPNNDYYGRLLDMFYKSLVMEYMDKALKCNKENGVDGRLKEIRRVFHKYCDNKSLNANAKYKGKVGIYGYGKYGKNLCYLLKQMQYDVYAIFDIKGTESGCREAIPIDEAGYIEEIEQVIVTVKDDEVFDKIRALGYKKVISMDEFLSVL